jgi:hypothetical protein
MEEKQAFKRNLIMAGCKSINSNNFNTSRRMSIEKVIIQNKVNFLFISIVSWKNKIK